MSIHLRCPVPGFDLEAQRIDKNFFAGHESASLLEDYHIWVEVMYKGGNTFVQREPTSWTWLVLPAKVEGVTGASHPDCDVATMIMMPGRTLRAAIVSENIRQHRTPSGINLALIFGLEGGGKGLFCDTLQPYGTS